MSEGKPASKISTSSSSDNDDYYYSPEGFIVFTEKYHLKRGYCCQSGCKHCPYGFDKKTGSFIKK